MNKYSFSDFEWFVPSGNSSFSITVPNEKSFNFGLHLRQELPPCVDIGFHPTEGVICIRKSESAAGFTVPKSGVIHAKELVQKALNGGAQIPARYTVARVDDFWIGTLDPYKKPSVNTQRPPKRPRKFDMSKFSEE